MNSDANINLGLSMILVSILGDFHSSIVPIFFEFKDQIKKHIIIHDDSRYDTNQLKKIVKGQEYFLEKNRGISISFVEYEIITISLDEDSYEDIEKCYNKIINLTKDPKELYLNATDGLNSISIILSSKFLKDGAYVLAYDRFANTYNLHTSTSMTKHKIKNNVDIKNHLKLKGYKLLSYTDKNELENRKKFIYKLMDNSSKYKQYVNCISERNSHCDNQAYFDQILFDIGKLEDITFIQGTVFEEYIYHLICDNFDFDDVMVGVSIEFEDNLKNEFDILMIKDNHLHTIECKFVNFIKGESFVYKTNSIMNHLDDDGKAMILSIGGENDKLTKSGTKKTQFTKGDISRAKNGRIKIHQSKVFYKDKFLKEIEEWFNIAYKRI